MPYNPYYLFEFIFNLIVLIACLYIPFRIILKYREYKKRELLHVGIAGLTMSEPFWFFPFNSLSLFLYDSTLPLEVQALIAGVGIPIGAFFWFYAMTDLIYKKHQKGILIFSLFYCIIFEVVYIPSVFFIQPYLREFPVILTEGYMQKFYQVNPGLFLLYILSTGTILFILFVTGLRFGYELTKTDDIMNRTQGRLIMLAFILFSSAFILIFAGMFIFITVPLFLICFILMYLAFVMPKGLRNRILRTKSE